MVIDTRVDEPNVLARTKCYVRRTSTERALIFFLSFVVAVVIQSIASEGVFIDGLFTNDEYGPIGRRHHRGPGHHQPHCQ